MVEGFCRDLLDFLFSLSTKWVIGTNTKPGPDDVLLSQLAGWLEENL